MARGSGPPRSDEPRGVSGPRTRVLQEDGKLRCPAGASLNFGRSASRECLYERRPSRLSYQTDCQPCSLREQCLAKGGQRRSSPSQKSRSVVSCLHPHRCLLSASRSCSDRSGFRGCGWASTSPHLDDPTFAGNTSRSFRLPTCRRAFPLPSPTTCGAVASPLERA